MTTQSIRDMLPAAPTLVAVIGFPPEDLAELSPAALGVAKSGGQVVDLDAADPGVPLEDPGSGAVAVIARTHTDLRRAASLAALLPKAAQVVIAVTTSPPDRPLALPPVPADWHGLLSVQARRGAEGEWALEARFKRARPVGGVVAALVRGLGGRRLLAAPAPRVALAGPGASHWRPGDPGVTLTTLDGPLGDPDEPPPADLVLRSVGPDPCPWQDSRVPVLDRPRPGPAAPAAGAGTPAPAGAATVRISAEPIPAEPDAIPPVDEVSVNPEGFVATPEGTTGVLARTGDRWSVRLDSQDLVRFHPSGGVTDADVARLRRLRDVRVEWGPEPGSVAAVRAVAGLAAAGVPLRAAETPPWAGALGADLTELQQWVSDLEAMEGTSDGLLQYDETTPDGGSRRCRTENFVPFHRGLGDLITGGVSTRVSNVVRTNPPRR